MSATGLCQSGSGQRGQHFTDESVEKRYMHEVTKVSAVSYLNTTPYLAGFQGQIDLRDKFEVTVDSPAECAEKLLSGNADVGLIPIAAVPELEGFRVLTDWGIGCDGAVGSVIIASEKPLSQVSTLLLDYQSRTSNFLATILIREYFGLELQIMDSREGYEKLIRGEVAGVIIGDRALRERGNFPYVYDLGECWKKHTGLPFVFARWVGVERLSAADEQSLDEIFKTGMLERETIAHEKREMFPDLDVYHYLTDEIRFDLSNPVFNQGQALFMEKMAMSEIIF